MKVLIAEDCATTQRLLTAMIERWGYETLVVADGNEAYATLMSEEDIHLAVIDWEMPGMDGPEVCRALERAARHVYCILLTGREGVESMAEALEAGASDYVRKPCCPTELRARIRSGERLLGLQRRVQEMSGAPGQDSERPAADGIQELVSNLRSMQKSITGVSLLMGDVRSLLQSIDANEGVADAAAKLRTSLVECGLEDYEGELPGLVVETQRIVRSLSGRLYAVQEAEAYAAGDVGEPAPADDESGDMKQAS